MPSTKKKAARKALSPGGAAGDSAQRSLDSAVYGALRPVVAGLAILYALVAVIDLIVVSSALLAALSLVSALLLLGLRSWIDRDAISVDQSHQVEAGLALLILLNGVIHLLVAPSPWQVFHVIVLLAGAGCLFLSTGWLALVVASTMIVWATASWFVLPRTEWTALAFAVWGAAVVCVVTHRARVGAYRRVELEVRRSRNGDRGLRSTLDLLPMSIALVDGSGKLIRVNEPWQHSWALHLFSVPASDSDANYLDCLDTAASNGVPQASEIADRLRKLLAGNRQQFSYEYSRPAATERRWFRLQAALLPGDEPARAFLTVEDITEQQRSKEQAREYELRYALAFRTANDGLWDWDLKRKEIYFSPRWKTILGFPEEDIGKNPEDWLSRIHGNDARALLAKLSDHLDGRSDEFEGQHRMKHADGSYRWILTRGIAIRDENGKAVRIVGSQADVTARKRAENLEQYDSMYDPLTGLPNRSHLRQQLKRAAADTGSKTNVLYALLYLDIDRFQLVNDSLGHTVGDHLLIGIADRLKKYLRPGDSIARLGGDEFAMLLENLNDVSQATEVANRIQVEVARPFKVGGQEVFTAVSIGIAMGAYGRETAGNLLRNADTALNRAKSHGRAHFELFKHHMHADALDLLSLETALQRALERNEFEAHYQPIVCLESGRITGCEALLRWRHPEKGMVPPSEFIPVAEEAGLIKGISDWILRTACVQAKSWQQSGLPAVRVAVNISPWLLRMEGFAGFVDRILADTGLEPELLQLELTESVLMESEPATIQPLVELSSRGIQISLDDFGTGYSSLTYLQRFPINTLKIDESFVRHVAINPGDAAIASGLIALAHNLNLRVVAEGVETHDQLEFCISRKCEEIQGRIISGPVDAEALVNLLKRGPQTTLALAQQAGE